MFQNLRPEEHTYCVLSRRANCLASTALFLRHLQAFISGKFCSMYDTIHIAWLNVKIHSLQNLGWISLIPGVSCNADPGRVPVVPVKLAIKQQALGKWILGDENCFVLLVGGRWREDVVRSISTYKMLLSAVLSYKHGQSLHEHCGNVMEWWTLSSMWHIWCKEKSMLPSPLYFYKLKLRLGANYRMLHATAQHKSFINLAADNECIAHKDQCSSVSANVYQNCTCWFSACFESDCNVNRQFGRSIQNFDAPSQLLLAYGCQRSKFLTAQYNNKII